MNSREITDLKGSMNNCPPLSEEIIEEGAELLSFWPAIRNDPRLAPHTAADLLAVWAHLQRFATGEVAGEIADRLDRLVLEEKERLAACFLRLSHPALDEAIIRLDRAWDRLGTWDACKELESETRDLFDALDRQSLVVYALQRLVPAESRLRPNVDELACNVEKAEQALLQHAESFYPAASLATAMLEEYRTDLAEVDRPLWLATVKYRRLADLYEEEEATADRDMGTGATTSEAGRRQGNQAIAQEDDTTAPLRLVGTEDAPSTIGAFGKVRRGIKRLVLEPLPGLALAAGNKPLPISSLPQSDTLTMEDGSTLHCTVFHNSEGKVVVTFSSTAEQLKNKSVLLSASDEQDGTQKLKNERIALELDEDGVLSGTFDLSVLDLRHRHLIEFCLSDD